MPTISRLAVVLTAKTKRFERGFQKATKRLDRFAGKMRQFGMRMAGISAAALTPIVLAVKRFADYGDTVAKIARRTGFSVELISRLGYAAGIAGADIESLEKGVKRMAKAITDGVAGMTTYVRAFELLGLKAENLATMTPEQAFLTIGKAIGEMEDPIKKAAAAQDLLGRAGTKLLPLFNQGAAGMERLFREADALGVTLDSKTAAAAEEATDAFARFKSALSGISITITQTLGIAFDKTSTVIINLSRNIRQLIADNAAWVRSFVKFALIGLAAGAALIALALAIKIVIFVAAALFAVIKGVAVILAIAAGPAGAIGLFIAGLVLLSDAIGLSNTGFLGFVNNIRVGGHSIGAWFTVISLEMMKSWERATTYLKKSWHTFTQLLATGMPGITALFAEMASIVQTTFLGAFKYIWKGISWIGSKLGWLFEKLTGISIDLSDTFLGHLEKGIDQRVKELDEQSRKRWEKFYAEHPGVAEAIGGKTEQLNKRLAERLKELGQAQEEVFGADLGKPGSLDPLKKKLAAFRKQAGDFWERLTKEDLGDAVKRLGIGAQLAVTAPAAERKLPGALERGSVEAYSAIVRATHAQMQKDKALIETAKNTGEQVTEQKKTNTLLSATVTIQPATF